MSKKLRIDSVEEAAAFLQHVSYFRFKEYSWTFKDYGEADGDYIGGTRFEQIRDLYYFDRRLKVIMFEAIEGIEVAVKTVLSNILSLKHGPRWYLDDTLFISEDEKKQIRLKDWESGKEFMGFDHSEFINGVEEMLEDPDEIFLKQYTKFYEPKFPPAWMIMEILTFGTLSRMFANLRGSDEKTAVCEAFKLTKAQLVSWLHCFAFLRNRCVHHARLVHLKVKFSPAMPQKLSRVFLKEHLDVDHTRPYAALSCMQFMLNTCNTQSCFKDNLKALFDQFPNVNPADLGFTANWRQETLWN